METPELAAMRAEYTRAGLDEADAGDEPFALFNRWIAEAVAAGVPEPNAMALATATADGVPSVRIVLLKGLDADGAVFHTNYSSRKGVELAANPHASAVLLWHPIARQVRIEGVVTQVAPEESDAYFLTRPRGGQVGAIASPQSQAIADRAELEARFERVRAELGDGDVPRPDHWGGYRLSVDSIEFWQGRENRLHDRLVFTRDAGRWRRQRLAP